MELTVNTSKRYTIRIERGALDQLGAYCASLFAPGKKAVVITDTHVAPLYLERVSTSLRNAGFDVTSCAFPAGEPSKRLSTIEGIYGHMAQAHITRSDFAVALGGGVTGDMAGFAAATYQRGIDYIQMPTTFLAASDSSVGGKTAVDLPAGKNLVGAFWPPRLVVCDCDTFQTLPEDTFADGVAETLKHGLIADAAFFDFLMRQPIREHLSEVVRRNVEIKAAVVAEDEYESGKRKLLNFGHTLGHAIEKCSAYAVPHGHAVAIGMVLATRAAERLGYSPKGTLETVLAGNRRYGLPMECPYAAQELYDAATGDKKRRGGKIDVVVLEEIGRAKTIPLDLDGLRVFVEAAL